MSDCLQFEKDEELLKPASGYARVYVNELFVLLTLSKSKLCHWPRVNFTGILRAAFMHSDPKSAKYTVKSSVFFKLLGSTCVKAACKMLMKSNPGISQSGYWTCLLLFVLK